MANKREQIYSEHLYRLPGMESYADWVPLHSEQVRCARQKPGVYTLGLKLGPDELIVPVYVGYSKNLRRRLDEHCNYEPDVILRTAFNRIGNIFWCATWSECSTEDIALQSEGMLLRLYDLQAHKLLNAKNISDGSQNAYRSLSWWIDQTSKTLREDPSRTRLLEEWWTVVRWGRSSIYRSLKVPIIDLDRRRVAKQHQ